MVSPVEAAAARSVSTMSPDHGLLVVGGEIELETAPQLRSAIESVLDGTGRVFTIDLAAVTFIDSSGLAVLIDATARASALRRRPSAVVERVLAVTGLSSTFEVEPA